jgi:hypothetical protein
LCCFRVLASFLKRYESERVKRSFACECAAVMNSSNKRAAILVLGVHRSGTSCLARLLNLLGAKLPEQLWKPTHTNVFGFWEPTKLIEIDEELRRKTAF